MSFANRDMNAWRGCRWRNCSGCGRAPVPGSDDCLSSHAPTQVAIGERRRPDPEGRPDICAVDTVHQGDQEGVKGLYHINAVDEVTQWGGGRGHGADLRGLADACAGSDVGASFPFPIRGFHSDNGSDFDQLQRSGLAQQAIGGADQVAAAPQQRQRTGGDEKRMGNSQAHRLRPYQLGACGSLRPVLSRAF